MNKLTLIAPGTSAKSIVVHAVVFGLSSFVLLLVLCCLLDVGCETGVDAAQSQTTVGVILEREKIRMVYGVSFRETN